MKTWLAGETARAQTPRYVRDNIHVSLLAKAYAAFVGATPAPGTVRRLNPSGYPESQGACAAKSRVVSAALAGSNSAHRANFRSRRYGSTPMSSTQTD